MSNHRAKSVSSRSNGLGAEVAGFAEPCMERFEHENSVAEIRALWTGWVSTSEIYRPALNGASAKFNGYSSSG